MKTLEKNNSLQLELVSFAVKVKGVVTTKNIHEVWPILSYWPFL